MSIVSQTRAAAALAARFSSRFSGAPAVYRAPGRVNLIGEHTDYNEGFVVPAAIGFDCWVAAALRNDRKLAIYSENFGESAEIDLDDSEPRPSGKWSDYPVGVAVTLERSGIALRGANLYIRGEVPLGAGLSSSAAVEVATGYALMDLSGYDIDRTRLALQCQRAENEFVGARCGIMDQFISCHGHAGHALLLDCRSLNYRLLRLPPQVRLVICNTMVRHELGASEYNTRRAECEEAVRLLAIALPRISALRDVNLAQLDQHRSLLTETLYHRCRHVVSENNRARKAAAAFESSDLSSLQDLTADSHRSLRDDFEVSCRELDLMVELASKQTGVFGARMTGGGFGGCTINFVDAAATSDFQRAVSAGYYAATGLQPDIYVCEASQGAEPVRLGAKDSAIELRASD